MDKKITLTQALEGYELAFKSRHLSQHTLLDYQNTFRKFIAFLDDDPPLAHITSHQVEQFLASQTAVSNKTVLNYHTGLSAFWTWAVKEKLVPEHILHKVDRPKPEKRAIVPFTEADIRSLLGVVGKSRTYARPYKKENAHSLPNQERNRAIILLLLDTGIRASELCGLCIHEVDVKNQRMVVRGKGSKERAVPISARTGQAIWRYLATRPDADAGEPLFATSNGDPMDRDRLLKQLNNIGERAGIANVHPHRFRHTFSINYLRNGGDPWTLQMILGHATMEMVRVYLGLAQADLQAKHRSASPVDKWRL